MYPFQQSVLTFVLAYFTYQAYRSWKSIRRYRQLVQLHDCAEPSIEPNILPGGLDHLWTVFTYKGEDILDELLVPRFHKFGFTYCERIFGKRTFHTADPRNFQAILGTDWDSFLSGAVRRPAFHPFLHQGLLCTDGAEWKSARALMKPSFSRNLLNNFASIEQHTERFLDALSMEPSSAWTEDVDMLERFSSLAMDIATDFFFGKSVGSQLRRTKSRTGLDECEAQIGDHSHGGDEDFVDAFDLTTAYTMQRSLAQDLYFLRDGRKFRKSVAIVHRYADEIVKIALQKRKQSPGQNVGDNRIAFLDELVESTQDLPELRDGVLTLLLAARDTTASLLGWVVFFLARHPTVFDRLREELLSRFGSAKPASELDYPQLQSVKYLQWVINETLRLHAVVSLTPRGCARDTVLPVGGGPDGSRPIVIMKGEKIFLNIYAAHQREDIWGADAREFRPERWEDTSIRWSFIPFGGGPRVCVGQHLGLAEASFVILRLCQHFDKVRHTDDRDNYSKAIRLTMSAAKGVRVQLHRAGKHG